jgi:hypothetical protein
MSEEFFDKTVAKINYNGTKGSGILVSPITKSCTYLITAFHCLKNSKNINYSKLEISRQLDCSLNILSIVNFNQIVVIEDKDLVIIKLEYLSDVPICQTSNLVLDEEVKFIGFPVALENNGIHRNTMPVKVLTLPGEDNVSLFTNIPLTTYSQGAIETTSGFSGSGIFKKIYDKFYLCGIVTKLLSPDGDYNAFGGILIECVCKKLLENKWDPLFDIGVCDFQNFEQNVIERFEEPLNLICSLQMSNIQENVQPNEIMEHCKNKLVWPYSIDKLKCTEIWENWLLYLIIRSIEDKTNLKEENYYIVNNSEGNRKIKLIYVTNKKTLSNFLKDYYQKAYIDINEGDFLIVENEGKSPANKMLSSSITQKIVTSICNPIGIEHHIQIDEVSNKINSLTLIHIDKIIDELCLVADTNEDENKTDKNLETRLG